MRRVLAPPELIDSDTRRDIGVVQFFGRVTVQGVGFLRVNRRQRLPFVEAYTRWVGFTGEGERKEFDGRVVGNEDCRKRFGGSEVDITREVVCVEGSGGCETGNGVLVQYEEEGDGVLMGVYVVGGGGKGGVFGRVSRVKRWLRRVGGEVRFSGNAEQMFEKGGIEGGGEWGGTAVGVVVLVVGVGVAGVVWGTLYGWKRRRRRWGEDSSSESSVDYMEFLRKEEEEKRAKRARAREAQGWRDDEGGEEGEEGEEEEEEIQVEEREGGRGR